MNSEGHLAMNKTSEGATQLHDRVGPGADSLAVRTSRVR